MEHGWRKILLAAAIAWPLASAGIALPDVREGERRFDEGITLALQGKLREALASLHGLDPKELEGRRRQAVEAIRQRFRVPRRAIPGKELGARVLAAYQDYWTNLMLDRRNAQEGERHLFAALRKLAGPGPGDAGEVEERLRKRLEADGVHALFGVTQPFRECMLWRSEREQTYPVELPSGREMVRVLLLDDFLSLGWTGFATGDYYHTAGWTKPDRLYCVRSAYDLDSEAFRVSYLGHEGQHFADARRFPKLEQPELEYRAKLAELSLAETTQAELLKAFRANRSERREQPHAWANQRLVEALARKLDLASEAALAQLDPAKLRSTAKLLLEEDTQRITSRQVGH